MTTYTAILLKTAPTIRSGTLTVPVWGKFHIEMELLDSERARLTVTQTDSVWRGFISLCHEESEDFAAASLVWATEISIGRLTGWTYRVTGRKRGDELVLEFDNTAKQPYRGAFAVCDARGVPVE